MITMKLLEAVSRTRLAERKGGVLAVVLAAGILVFGGRMIAAAPQQTEKTVKAPKIAFLIKTVGDDDRRHKAKFKVGEPVLIEMLVRNNSAEEANLVETDSLFQYRFQLLRSKDRSLVPLRAGVRELAATREAEPGPGKRMVADPMPPSGQRTLRTLDLQDWYGQLEPGKYKLTVQYRPDTMGGRANSNTATFEVVP